MRGGDPALASRAPQARAGPPAAVTVGRWWRRARSCWSCCCSVSAAAPPAAEASGILGTGISIPNPISLIGSGISSLLGGLGGDIAKLAVGAFEAIIRALFAPIAKFITTQLIGWVITVPNLTQGNVTRLEQTVEAMAGGLLGAVATISTIRYWAAGFAGGGDSGFAALEGLIRTVAAALFLASWPWVFESGVHLTNLFTSSLMGSTAVVDQTARLLAAGLGAGVALSFTPIGLFCNIAMAVAASLLFLGLLLLKVVVSASTILVFVGMPLAAVAWPVVPWVARAAMRAFAVCLLVPALWALCFAAGGAAMLNAISFNAPSALNALLQPLVAIVLLYVMLKLPMHLARVAMLGAAPLGGGFVSRAVSYAAGSQVRDTARQHLPSWAGGQRDAQQSQPQSRTATRLRTAATLAGAAASGGAAAAGAAMGGGGQPAVPPRAARLGLRAQRTVARMRRRRALRPTPRGRCRTGYRPRASPAGSRTSPTRGSRRSSASGRAPCRPNRPERRSRVCPVARSAGSDSSSQITVPARASISPTRRWANGRRRSARRCARSPPPAPTCAPRPSAMPPARSRMASTQAAPVRRRPAIPRGSQRTAAASAPRETWADGDPGGSPARSAGDPATQSVPSATASSSPRRGSSAWARFRRGSAAEKPAAGAGAQELAAAARAARSQPRRTVPERIRRLDRAHRPRPSRIEAALLGLHRRPDRRGVRRDHARLHLGEVRLAAARDAGRDERRVHRRAAGDPSIRRQPDRVRPRRAGRRRAAVAAARGPLRTRRRDRAPPATC